MRLTLVNTLDDALELKRWLSERREFLGLDTETSGLRWYQNDVLRTVQFGDPTAGWTVPVDEWRGLVREVLTGYEGRIVLHNLSFDAHFLEADGLPVPWDQLEDTLTAARLLNPDERAGLKVLAARKFGSEWTRGEQLLKVAMHDGGWDWRTIPVDCPPLWQYAALDAVLTSRLAEQLIPEVQREYSRVYDLEMSTLQVLYQMERRGMQLDVAYCERSLGEWRPLVRSLRERAHTEYGVRPSSPRELVRWFQANGARLTKRTEGGQLAMDEEVLVELQAADYQLAELSLKFREYEKRIDYLEKFLELRDKDDVLHCTMHSLAARTGRMSVTEPALQTLPRGTEIRDAIVAREGHRLLIYDANQIEYRLIAHFSQDQGMLEAIRSGEDLHTYTAKLIFRTETPTTEQRRVAKQSNYAKSYGARERKYAMTAGISEAEAYRIYTRYAEELAGVESWIETVTATVKQRERDEGAGWVRTPLGRQLVVPRGKHYVGVNFLIQGTAAEVLKRGLVDMDCVGIGENLLLPVHDEAIAEATEDDIDEVEEVIRDLMPDWSSFSVPLTVDGGRYERWGDKYREKGD